MGTNGLEPSTSRLSGVRSNHLSYAPKQFLVCYTLSGYRSSRPLLVHISMQSGDEEDRTPDPLRARQVLSQLSYTPIYPGDNGFPFVLLLRYLNGLVRSPKSSEGGFC